MPLTSEEVRALVEELEGLEGARVEKVHQRDGSSVVLALRMPRHPEEKEAREGAAAVPPGKLHLLLSARSGFARVHLIEERGAVLPAPDPFGLGLRSRLKGARISAVRQPRRGRTVAIHMAAGGPRPASPRGPPPPRRRSPRRLILLLELAGSAPNLVLLDGRRRLLASLKPVERPGPGEGGPLRHGERYAPRASPPHPSAMAGVGASPWRYLPPGKDRGLHAPPLERLFPLNLALGRYYAEAEEASRLSGEREDLVRRLSAALVRRRKLLPRLEEDLARSRAAEAGLRLGELLKGEIHRIRKGMKSVEVVDYYSADLPKLAIALDPALGPRENIERYFERYRKAQRAVPIISGRLARVEEEIGLLSSLKEEAESAPEGASVAGIEERARPLLPRPPPAPRSGPAAPLPRGPRRFVSRDGLEILVGRSARENDELTFKIARGRDVFLHVAGRAGPHVIIRSAPPASPPLETLLDAAQLALYYTFQKGGGGGALRGTSADVDYVEVKHVRKPRSSRPGVVLLSRHRTLRVSLEEERLGRLRGGAGD